MPSSASLSTSPLTSAIPTRGGLGKGGKGTHAVDGKTVGESRIEKTNPLGKFTLDESFDVGQDTGSPVIDEYDAKMPFKFNGKLERVMIELK
jgi:arylsulfatase